MGPCAGSKPTTDNKSPQLPITNKPLVSKPMTPTIASAPQYHNNGLNAKNIQPQEIHNSKNQPEANALQENEQQIQLSKSGRPSWNVPEAKQEPQNPKQNLNQSPIHVVYSSDPKQQVQGFSSPDVPDIPADNPHNLNLIDTINEVPSFMEGDSKKISVLNSQNVYKNEEKMVQEERIWKEGIKKAGIQEERIQKEGIKKAGIYEERIQKEGVKKAGIQEERIQKEGVKKVGIQEERIQKEGIQKVGIQEERIQKEGIQKAGIQKKGIQKVHGQEQILPMFRQFEISIFEISLSANS